MPIYTRTRLKAAVNGRIHGKLGVMTDPDMTINDAVKEVIGTVDLRSMKRRVGLTPNLFNQMNSYKAPLDLKGRKIITLLPQNQDFARTGPFSLVTEDDFNLGRYDYPNAIALSESDFIRKILISADQYPNTPGFAINSLNSLIDAQAGSWTAFGDAINLREDRDNFVTQNASIAFDISGAGGTTAGIQSLDVSLFNLVDYAVGGSLFVWAWVANPVGITNYVLRIGNDASNYYTITVTATNEANAFVEGLNLLRFDLSTKQITGTVDLTNLHYVALYMTKTAGKINEIGYRFNYLQAKRGSVQTLVYYTKFAWQDTNGAYKEDSTANSDFLNVETDEYNMILEKCVEHAALDVREGDDSSTAAKKYENLKKMYQRTNKSEALMLESSYL